MKHTIGLLVFTAVLHILTGCGAKKAEEQKKSQDDLAKEVMAIHDEVMPRMGELVGFRKQLKTKINAWTQTNTAESDAVIMEATALVEKLDAADKGMMDWMHEYNGGQGLYEHELIMEYLRDEKSKIEKVRTDMNLSIEEAKQFIESHP